MSSLVVYSSVTGNTRKIAEAIASGFSDAVIAPADNAPAADGFDNVFVGFWCDKGMVDEKALNYLKAMKPGKVAVFGTLGGNPKSELSLEFQKKARETIPAHLELVDLRMWQGKIDPKVIEMMSRLPGAKPMTPERKARLDEAAKHPNEQDCAEAADWARSIAG